MTSPGRDKRIGRNKLVHRDLAGEKSFQDLRNRLSSEGPGHLISFPRSVATNQVVLKAQPLATLVRLIRAIRCVR